MSSTNGILNPEQGDPLDQIFSGEHSFAVPPPPPPPAPLPVIHGAVLRPPHHNGHLPQPPLPPHKQREREEVEATQCLLRAIDFDPDELNASLHGIEDEVLRRSIKFQLLSGPTSAVLRWVLSMRQNRQLEEILMARFPSREELT